MELEAPVRSRVLECPLVFPVDYTSWTAQQSLRVLAVAV